MISTIRQFRRTQSFCVSLSISVLASLAMMASLGCGGGSSFAKTAPPKTLSALAVSPATTTLAVGASEQFNATATYSDSSTAIVTSAVSWTSSAPGVATIDSSGMVRGVAAGSTTVTGSMNGVTGSATVTVTANAKTVSSIAITPANPNVSAGATEQMTATATYNDGSTANVTSTATWKSGNLAVATVNTAGLVTAVAAGNATITASLNGVTGSTTVAVSVPVKTLSSLAITPANPKITAGGTQQLTATATYNDGSTANVTATATWRSGNSAAATVNAAGVVTAVAAGNATISATLSGITASTTVTVTAAVKTLSSIAITPVNPTVTAGNTQQLTATATYSDSSTANVTATATWTSANSAVATVNPAGTVTAVAAGSTAVTASLNGVSGSTTVTVPAPKTLSSIAVTSSNSSVAMGSTQQLTATATYSDGSTANVTTTAVWTASNGDVASVNATGLLSGVAAGSTTITATLNNISGSLPFVVTIAPGTGVNITTAHVDVLRTGLNPGEQSLSPGNVSAKTFGKLFSYLVDGYVYGQPLIVSNLTVNGGTHNVVYVATEHDSVYAFDADNYGNGTPLWQVSLLKSGETPVMDDPAMLPYDGVTSTPVIDLSSNTIYVVSKQSSSTAGHSFRLHALDITTGAEKFGGPVTVQASVPGTNSESVNGITYLSTACIQRAALLLENGTIYMGFGSCPHGWFLAYNAKTLAQTAVFNSSPNLNGMGPYASAGGVWMGGGGPAADSAGNVYITTGNGPWDGKTAWGDSILKFNSQLQIQDYFTPVGYQYMNCEDADLAAGGLLLIPGSTPQALAGGKTGKMYMVNTSNLGKNQPNDAGATQTIYFDQNLSAPYTNSCTDPSTGTIYYLDVNSYEIFGTAAYFNGSVYLGVSPTASGVPAGVRQFNYSGGMLTPGPETSPSVQQASHGTTPFVSANGTSNGIVWMIDHGNPIRMTVDTASSAILRAYDANNLPNELYDSSMNSGDAPGYGIKFSAPIVANGKAYVATGHDLRTATNPKGEIDVYGLK